MTTLEAVPQSPTQTGTGSVRTIVLPQRFDVHEVSKFEGLIANMLAAGIQVVIDASEVRHMDRSAMDCLIEARLRCMDHGGDLNLIAASVAARVILELSGRYEALNPIDEFEAQDPASLIEVAA